MTNLTITPNISAKCASAVGRIAVGEHVSVTIVGAASLKTPTLQLRAIAGSTTVAMFPPPVDDGEERAEWTVQGDDLVCEFNLNTVQALEQCRRRDASNLLPYIFLLEELGDAEALPKERCPCLYFVAPHPVLCWPQRLPGDTPFDFDDYPSTFRMWQRQISNIAMSVTKEGTVVTIRLVDKDGVETVATITEGGGASSWDDITGKPSAFPPEAHSQGWSTITGKPSSFPPSSHASTHAAGGSDAISPSDIGALPEDGMAAKAEVLRNDATWQEAEIEYDEQIVARINVYDRSQSQSGQLVGKVAYTDDIPALASPSTESTAQGKAADAKATADFVNSSINAMAAFYLTADAAGNAFATKAALTSATTFYNGGVARTPTKNDYLIVLQDESKTTALGVNPTTRYVFDGTQWAYQYIVNNTALTQAQVNAINSGVTAALVAWLSAFKGTDTATTLASILNSIADKLDNTDPVVNGILNFNTALTIGQYNGGRLAENPDGSDPKLYAYLSELEYEAYHETRIEGRATSRTVSTYKVVAGTPLTITLPTVSASDKYVTNLDLVIDTLGVATLPAITIQPATGGKCYAVDGAMPEIKADSINVVDATSIPGMNAWMILGASELTEVQDEN